MLWIFGHQRVKNKNTDYPQNVIINSFRYGQIICCASILIAKALHRAVVVAQLVTQTLPTPEVRDSNAVIGKNFMLPLIVLKREKIKKRGREWPIFQKGLYTVALHKILASYEEAGLDGRSVLLPTSLHSEAFLLQVYLISLIKTSKTGGQLYYSDTSLMKKASFLCSR